MNKNFRVNLRDRSDLIYFISMGTAMACLSGILLIGICILSIGFFDDFGFASLLFTIPVSIVYICLVIGCIVDLGAFDR
jgi:hypothetical protein